MKEIEERIKRDVVDELFKYDRVNISDIVVEVSGGKVSLNGTVPSSRDRKAAEEICFSIPGVTMVENNLIPKLLSDTRPIE
jgi:osmotically-inducible protein OsmY